MMMSYVFHFRRGLLAFSFGFLYIIFFILSGNHISDLGCHSTSGKHTIFSWKRAWLVSYKGPEISFSYADGCRSFYVRDFMRYVVICLFLVNLAYLNYKLLTSLISVILILVNFLLGANNIFSKINRLDHKNVYSPKKSEKL